VRVQAIACKRCAIGGLPRRCLGGDGRRENTLWDHLLGSAISGTAGAIIEKQMDRQAEELEKDSEKCKIERVGEGIKITFDSGLMFDRPNLHLQTIQE